MGDGGAAGERGGAHRRRRVGVHPDALALGAGLVAGGEDLRVGERLAAALADGFAGEDLDHVGAVGGGLADVLPDLIGREGGVVERCGRGEEARAGQLSARDRRAQGEIGGGADALHGGEARHQQGVGGLGIVERAFGRRIAGAGEAAVGAEMADDVDVGVDQAGKDGEALEVVGWGGVRGGGDAGDAGAVEGDDLVAEGGAFAVEEEAGADCCGLGGGGGGGQAQK